MQMPKLTPDNPQSDIKEQFKQGPPQKPTQEQIDAEEQRLTTLFKERLPFMKLQQEFNETQIKLMEQSVLLGMQPINSVPGLLGMELAIREVRAKEFLSNYANEMQHRIAEEQELLKRQQESKTEEPGTQAPGNNETTN